VSPTDQDRHPRPLPSGLLAYSRADVANQRVPLSLDAWAPVLESVPQLAVALGEELEMHGGIRRPFVHDRAGGDPVELFLAAMTWGFGTTTYGPARVNRMMSDPGFERNVAAIIADVRTQGAGPGWTSLLLTHKIHGLGMAYGTKLLYFAGYEADQPGPRPLVLDQFVRAALVHFGAPIVARGTIWRDNYINYLTLAERWASDRSWGVAPDVVEFGLFDLGKAMSKNRLKVDDDDAQDIRGESAP
jgi:hypothetical protein